MMIFRVLYSLLIFIISERERRLEARNTALQLSTVELEKKIQSKVCFCCYTGIVNDVIMMS